MPQQLHVLTRPADELVQTLIEQQRRDPGNRVEVVDLAAGPSDDAVYRRLVEQVFAADSIAVW